MTLGGDRRGLRASQDGGYWQFYRDPDGRAVVSLEVWELTDKIGTDDALMLKAEIRQKMEAAKAGRLRFGEKEDVSSIWREPDLCELRLGHVSFDEEEPSGYKHRLYFAEPPQVQRLMLGLKFARKPATKAGLEHQDEHIDCASKRYIEGVSRLWGTS